MAAVRDTAPLVEAARSGDEAALGELLAAHLPLVYNYVGRALNGHADVDDLVQETMIQAIRGLPGLREPERFRSWLASIAYRQVQTHLRGRRRALLRRGEAPPELPDPGSDFAERTVTGLMLTGQRRELAEATRWLDDGDRHLLSLWWQEAAGELTRAELAAVLGLGAKHAGVRVQRMKVQLDAARAVVRALAAAHRCGELEALTHRWNGRAEPVWRKRLTRHVRDCPRCRRHRDGLVAPEKLLFGAALLPVAMVPVAARAARSSIWATLQNAVSTKAAAGVAVAAVIAGGGFTYAVYETPSPSPAARPSAAPVTPPPATGVTEADIFVAPDGSDSGPGSLARPFATLGKAVAVVRPGQTIALRGGTYRPTAPVTISTSGTPDRRITLTSYRGERPVIDAARVPAGRWAITQRASYWTVQRLEVKNSGSNAYVCEACRYTVFQNLSIHDNVRSGLALWREGTIGNQVLDSDFFNTVDPADKGRSGVGLEVKFGSGEGNVLRGNRAFDNADNGIDVGYFASPIAIDRNWAYGNGVNRWRIAGWQSNADGFHLGGAASPPAAAHVLTGNAAWDNANNGFSGASNRGAIRLTNNTAFRNGNLGFDLAITPAVVRANAAGANAGPGKVGYGGTAEGNSWQGAGVSFRSTDPRDAQGPRGPGGELPRTDFLVTGDGTGAAMR